MRTFSWCLLFLKQFCSAFWKKEKLQCTMQIAQSSFIYTSSAEKSPLNNYNCDILNGAWVQSWVMLPVAMQMQAVMFSHSQSRCQRFPAPAPHLHQLSLVARPSGKFCSETRAVGAGSWTQQAYMWWESVGAQQPAGLLELVPLLLPAEVPPGEAQLSHGVNIICFLSPERQSSYQTPRWLLAGVMINSSIIACYGDSPWGSTWH